MTRKQTAIIKEWVRRLRSGKIKQCTNRLVFYRERCCMGVLGNVIGARKFGNNVLKFQSTITYACLSDTALKVAGVSKAMENIFIDMNDNQRFTFKQIADKIEKYYKLLEK